MSIRPNMFAYFRTQDNTIVEQELVRFDSTTGLSGALIADEYAKAFEFELLQYGPHQWDNEDWEAGYAALELRGYFTRERQEELFDTLIVGTLDRIDVEPPQCHCDGTSHPTH